MQTYIIDAYNVMHAWKKRELIPYLVPDAHRFLSELSPLADAPETKVIVVFDGAHPDAESIRSRFRHIEIFFSSKDASADSVIEKQSHASEGTFAVVTSDRTELDIASGAGARIISPLHLWDMLQELKKKAALERPDAGKPRKRGFSIEEILGEDK
jgi:predicted RNA-binding protein with PIN domain